MNADRRKQLDNAIKLLESAKKIIEDVQSQEQEAFANLSENLQQSERGSVMEAVAEALSNCASNLEDAISELQEAQQ